MNKHVRVGVAALAMSCALALSAQASARTLWVCDVPNEGTVTFVSAADAARHGIDTANARAAWSSTIGSGRPATSSPCRRTQLAFQVDPNESGGCGNRTRATLFPLHRRTTRGRRVSTAAQAREYEVARP